MSCNSPKRLFCHLHFEGKLVISLDGSYKYEGGRMEGFGIDDTMDYQSFVEEACERLDIDKDGVTIKYTVGNRTKPPSAVRKVIDFKNFFLFNKEEVDVYIFKEGQSMVPVQSFGGENDESSASARNPAEVILDFTTDFIGTGNMASQNPAEVIPDFTTNFIGTGNTAAQNPTEVMPDLTTNSRGVENAAMLGCGLWEEIIECVGQKFPTSDDLRVNLEKYAMTHKFRYNFVKNDGTYIKAKCATDGCPWRVLASKVRNTTEFCIYKFEPKHVHTVEEVSKFRTSKKLVSRFVEERIRRTPGYTPRQIVKDFVKEFGVQLPYKQAWRARELAIEALHGSPTDSYRRLSWFCEKIKESNSSSVAFVTTEQNRFRHCFIAFRASLNGFLEGCRPILFIDYIFLKAKFKGTIISAQACDANNEMYPVAFGVMSGDTFNDWTWFLKNLKDALNTDREILIISDRNVDIIGAVHDVFGHGLHAYCFKHLEQNVFEHLRGKHLKPILRESLKNAMWKAASARLPPDYAKAMQTIKAISPEAHRYLEDNSPEHWAVSKFPRRCFDLMTLNMTETFSSWILEAKDLPICSLIDKIRINMMTLISKCHAEQWKCVVGPRVDHEMKVRLAHANGLTHYQSSSVEHEVRDGETSHRVNLHHRGCTCMDWYHSGLPCVHACTVLKGLGMDPYAFVDTYYKREAHDRIYTYSIYPIDTWDRQSVVDDAPLDEVPEIHPPLTRSQRGRPRKPIELKKLPKRDVHCTKCGRMGHYQRTCANSV